MIIDKQQIGGEAYVRWLTSQGVTTTGGGIPLVVVEGMGLFTRYEEGPLS